MNNKIHIPWLISINVLILSVITLACIIGNKAINTAVENVAFSDRKTVIIDAGHGGIDSGATSCTGVPESKLNLEIALRLDDLFHLLGIPTKMIRTTDRSIHTQGETIAAQKISDLKNRVRIINETENAMLISIHQNYFSASQYAGAQVFFGPSEGSDLLAKQLQDVLVSTINTGSKRKAKKAEGIYLMEHISCPGVLLECGFISNPDEEYMLRTKQYQTDLCCVITAVCTNYLNNTDLS